MTRELRITLAIMAVVLLAFSPLIFAEPNPAAFSNYNYLAMVFRQEIPTIAPSPTNAPTLTATVTRTPAPTLTPTEVTIDIPPVQPPCDQNQPQQIAIGAQAWMSIPSPSRYSQTTICARYIFPNGSVYRGAVLNATAHYKTTDTFLGSVQAGNDGVAHISFNIGGATAGYTVVVDGLMAGTPFSASFTPH